MAYILNPTMIKFVSYLCMSVLWRQGRRSSPYYVNVSGVLKVTYEIQPEYRGAK